MNIMWARSGKTVHAFPSTTSTFTLCGLRVAEHQTANQGRICGACKRECLKLNMEVESVSVRQLVAERRGEQ